MPQFGSFPFPRRYNSLRLLSHDYSSLNHLYAISLVTNLRRPVFADVKLAKCVLACLLSDELVEHMSLCAFTLMPNHLHLVAGVRESGQNLSRLIGTFKSYTTQLYWSRSREIVETGEIELASTNVVRSDLQDAQSLIEALKDWRANLRPEVVKLANWPAVKPYHFLKKCLWQSRFFDHVIRNDADLHENLDYIAMNPVHAGYVTRPEFYPYTGFVE